uniref:Dioxygenase str8 n=1 Tax=Strobilurus tenacellus TaxID=41251 RepID=STR8_STRTC|nr:RecName: Full=Dioxygenase str8; AltName: Full=Strobilurin A biosynthesis cluster protein r8 [Strobilurus tenacellus]ATV82118.1 clavaminate synthase [Strobilurus tenacellus]
MSRLLCPSSSTSVVRRARPTFVLGNLSIKQAQGTGASSALARRRRSTFAATADGLHVIPLEQKYPFPWLRDACRCPDCVHPSTRQKLFCTSDIPVDIQPATNGVEEVGEGVKIRWSNGHESLYDWDFLKEHSSSVSRSEANKDLPRVGWTRASIAKERDLYLEYEELKTKEGLRKAIDHTCRFGLLFIRNVPNVETSTASCSLRTLAHYFGDIRTTFYGELWDVKNVSNSRNIAYTNLGLGLHMDLLYFQHPPQFQFLHCLRNRVQGGSSIFSDALHAAETLRIQDAASYSVLTDVQVPFFYVNDGHHLYHTHPTIEVSASGDVNQINYSPPFQAPLLLDTPPAFFTALHQFSNLVNSDENTYEYTLEEGDAVLFDNRRVLHARRAFEEIPGQGVRVGEANRWLKGCYIEGDTMWDRGRMLR